MIAFPIGTKKKCFIDKINITAHLQCKLEKEINSFYHNIPLSKTPFDKNKSEKSNKKYKNVSKKIR